jgi:hypothetical protein
MPRLWIVSCQHRSVRSANPGATMLAVCLGSMRLRTRRHTRPVSMAQACVEWKLPQQCPCSKSCAPPLKRGQTLWGHMVVSQHGAHYTTSEAAPDDDVVPQQSLPASTRTGL